MKFRVLCTTVLCAIACALVALAQEPAPPESSPGPAPAQSPPLAPVPAAVAASPEPTPMPVPSAAPVADHKPTYQYIDRFADLKPNPRYPIDYEPQGQHSINDFLVESRDIFHQMDQVMTPVLGADGKPVPGADGKPMTKLMPLDFHIVRGTYDPGNRDQRAVFGRNTWLIWCGGNEDFWDWLAQRAYGVLDYLQVIDSRKRGTRLADSGLINQPGMKGTHKPGPWGLYIDTVEKRIGEEGEFGQPGSWSPYSSDAKPPYSDFKDPQGRSLQSDGVDPKVYGYPSGVIGFRLFPNPKFDADAQKRWNAEAFYTDHSYATDPRTVRPYTVGMSCALCHVSIHPLNPPANAEEPQWSNLSSTIGAQYFRTRNILGSRTQPGNFLEQYLASQQPGCVDTSMTVTDQIDNANSMNAVFELPARLARAQLNPTETQSKIAQTMYPPGEQERRIARVLMDGADSIGLYSALLRVYLNIGLYHDEWARTSNMIIGLVPQKPFSIEACRSNSLYWRVNENFRIGYLADFFLWEKKNSAEYREKITDPRYQCSTQAMSLADARVTLPDGTVQKFVETPAGKAHWDQPKAVIGARVFTENCMVCHSSKQPEGYRLDFAHQPPGAKTWHDLAASPDKLTMPFAWENWEDFKKSPAYADYLAKARPLTGENQWDGIRAFLKDNYLSSDIRIPVTLTATNSARAVGTNGLKGQVWGEFASDTYQSLPPVGKINYTDPISDLETSFEPPGNGLGYYRVPSLVSVWSGAPLLNTNALGKYIGDDDVNRRVSVAGRLEMFDDAIEKLLNKSKRGETPSGYGGLRGPDTAWRGKDSGWVYRTDMETDLFIPAGDLRELVVGVLPGLLPGWLGSGALWLLDMPKIVPLVLAFLSLLLFLYRPRAFFYLVFFSGLLLALLLAATGVYHLVPWVIWLLPLALAVGGLAWIVPKFTTENPATLKGRQAAAAADAKAATGEKDGLKLIFQIVGWGGVAAYALLLLAMLVGLWTAREFVNGNLGDLRVGPLPKGIPVSALMNLNPEAPLGDRLAAVRGLCSMLGKLHAENAKERQSDEKRRRILEKHPATAERDLPKPYRFSEEDRRKVFDEEAGPALMKASKCPDFALDRGHYFGESLSQQEKEELIAFLKTL